MLTMASLKIVRVASFAALSSGERNHLNSPRTESVVEALTSRPASAAVDTSTDARAIAFELPASMLLVAKSANAWNVAL